MDNKEKYAGLINRSPLFSLDKEKEAIAFKRESLKMVEYLYCYLMVIDQSKYEEYALEITQTAYRCINNYSSEAGSFLGYFLSAMKVEYRRAFAKNTAQQMRSGIHIVDDDERNLRKLCRYLEQKGIENPNEQEFQTMAEILDLPVRKVKELIRMNQETVVVSEFITNDEDEEISLFDTIASEDDCDNTEVDSNVNDQLARIEREFSKLQERSKPIVSAVLTAKMCQSMDDSYIDIGRYVFIDKMILNDYLTSGKVPTQREIAERFEKNEASISRTVNEFLRKVGASSEG